MGIKIDPKQTIDRDYVPLLMWPKFFYAQQKDFVTCETWQRWFIGGNGTGKTLILYWSIVAYLMGVHPHQNPQLYANPMPLPPLKCRIIVPSFDSVEDVALDKLHSHQVVIFEGGQIELGPILSKGFLKPKSKFTKDHRYLEFKNGSSMGWVTSEQGWQFMRGSQYDILAVDEDCDERVFDECLRGLRNAKGGGKVLAALTPPYKEGQGPTWTKEKIVEASVNDADITVINACMADNPAITKQFIDRFTRGKSAEQIRVQVYGQYPHWGDLVHAPFENRLWDPKTCTGHILPNDTPLPENWEVDWVMAFDWHQSKPCAAVWGYIKRDGTFVVFDELDKEWAKGKDINQLSEAFFSIEGHPHNKRRFRRWQDPSAKSKYNAIQKGFNAWDAFRKNGIVTSVGKNRDPEIGINIVNEYLRGNGKDHPRMFIYERCKYTRQYMENHYYRRGADGVGRPDPKWSDYPICIRYILGEVGWKKRERKKKWPLVSYKEPESDKKVINLEGFF